MPSAHAGETPATRPRHAKPLSRAALLGGVGFEPHGLPGVFPDALPTELPACILIYHGIHLLIVEPVGCVSHSGIRRHIRPAKANFLLLGERFGLLLALCRYIW